MTAKLPPLTLEQCVLLGCMWEVSVPKLGNVHRGADFADTTLYEFLTSAALIARHLTCTETEGIGARVLQAVLASRGVTRGNTHLGSILLLGPLCAVPRDQRLAEGIDVILRQMTHDDTRQVYEAIRVASPGGLGTSARGDVTGPSEVDLMTAMGWAAERDRVARQYIVGFADILEDVAPRLCRNIQRADLIHGILVTQLELMTQWPDSLISRKCGHATAVESTVRARRVLDAYQQAEETWASAAVDFDFWLRSDGNRRNPGTTADLIAAGLFCALREGQLQTFSWEA